MDYTINSSVVQIHTSKSLSRKFSSSPSAAYMRNSIRSALVQVMASRLFGAKPLRKPMLTCTPGTKLQRNYKSLTFNKKNPHLSSAKVAVILSRGMS